MIAKFLLIVSSTIVPLTVLAQSTNAGLSPHAEKTHQVVLEIVDGDPKTWESALNNIENLSTAFRDEKTNVELVAHGDGLKMLQKINGAKEGRIRDLSKKNVRFVACENTMKRMNVKKSALFDFTETVDSGVAEVIRKQESGWSYIKSGK